MSIDKLPSSAVRQQTQAAGARLVEQKAVTQKDLDDLLRNPVIGVAERMEAKALIGALRARIETGALSGALTKDIGKFEKAIGAEQDASTVLTAAHAALTAGAIDKTLYAKLTGTRIPLRAASAVYSAAAVAAQEVDRLKPLVAGAGPDTKAALQQKLTDAQAKSGALSRLKDAIPETDLVGGVLFGTQMIGVVAAAVMVAMMVTGQWSEPGIVHEIVRGAADIGAIAVAATFARAFVNRPHVRI